MRGTISSTCCRLLAVRAVALGCASSHTFLPPSAVFCCCRAIPRFLGKQQLSRYRGAKGSCCNVKNSMKAMSTYRLQAAT